MLYWLRVYLLVGIGVTIPFFVLYVGAFVLWLTVTAIHSRMGSIRFALTLRPHLPVPHWGIRRKAA